MSRPSAASLSVVPIGLPERLAPPEDLTEDQAKRWRSIVDANPVDWFGPNTAPLLKEYVRAEAMCDLLAFQIEAAMAGDPVETALLLKGYLDMRDKESKRLTSIGTKLRLTQQSRYTPQAAATAGNRTGEGAKPWQTAKR